MYKLCDNTSRAQGHQNIFGPFQFLWGLDTFGRFLAISAKGGNVCDSLFALPLAKSLLKELYSIRKEFAPRKGKTLIWQSCHLWK